jgi:SAM-dependent methyltransferase
VRFTVDIERLPPAIREWMVALPEGLGSLRFFRASDPAYVDRLLSLTSTLARRPRRCAPSCAWPSQAERAGLVELDPWGRVARHRALTSAAGGGRARRKPARAAPRAVRRDARGFVDVAAGRRRGADVLLTPAALPLWQAYFDNANFGYAANNVVAARLCVEAAGGRRELRVLELGGGFGSAAEAVLARLAPRLARYVFSEVSPYFLGTARRRLARAFPAAPLEFRALDVNQEFAGQGVADASADLVLAVNVMHVSRDVGRTLGAVRRVLAPGGSLVMVECVRPAPGVPVYAPVQLLDEFCASATRGRRSTAASSRCATGSPAPSARLRLRTVFPDHARSRSYSGYHLVGLTAAAPVTGARRGRARRRAEVDPQPLRDAHSAAPQDDLDRAAVLEARGDDRLDLEPLARPHRRSELHRDDLGQARRSRRGRDRVGPRREREPGRLRARLDQDHPRHDRVPGEVAAQELLAAVELDVGERAHAQRPRAQPLQEEEGRPVGEQAHQLVGRERRGEDVHELVHARRFYPRAPGQPSEIAKWR